MTRSGEAEFTGRIEAITLPSVGGHPTFKAQVGTEDGPVELVFVGYRMLPGFRVGRTLTARGTIVSEPRPMMYNPIYWLKAETV